MKTNSPEKRTAIRDIFLFFKAFLRNPAHVGAVIPSSHHLADGMTSFKELPQSKVIIELGCGTGAITRSILEKIPANATYIGVELDESCVKRLREYFPGKLFHNGSAENIGHYLTEQNAEQADAIISGLPWAVLPDKMQNQIFSEIVQCLAPEGVFVTFAYSHAKGMNKAKLLRKRLNEHFGTVEISSTVWMNLPPAFFYTCRSPKK